MKNTNVIIITENFFHPLGHRIQRILPIIEKKVNVEVISIGPYNHDEREKYTNYPKLIVPIIFIINLLLKKDRMCYIREGGDKKILIMKFIPVPPIIYYSFSPLFFLIFIKRYYKRKLDKDLVIISESPVSGKTAFLSFKRENKFIYDFIDRTSFFYSGITKILIDKFEKSCVKSSNLVICVGHGLKNIADEFGQKNTVIIHNGIDYSLFSRKVDVEKIYDLIYVGVIEKYVGLDIIINVLEILENVTMLIIGDGTHKKKLLDLIKSKELEKRIHFIGRVPYEELPRYLQSSKIGIATYLPNELMKYAFTLKIIEYMASGLPVIATNIGDTGRIIRLTKSGILINKYDSESIVEAIRFLLKNEEEYKKFSANGKKTARDFDWKKLAEKMVDVIST